MIKYSITNSFDSIQMMP